jgi:hypothetical protein
MGNCRLCPEEKQAVEAILGYLNFSSGTPDAKLLANLNQIWDSQELSKSSASRWQAVGELLKQQLDELADESAAFEDAAQAAAILELVWNHLLPGYLDFHRDLLFHQQPDELFNAFFVGRACEALLAQGPPWDETDRVTSGAIKRLNDFVGYRPVAVLESKKIEPYPHERVRPIPLFVRGAGVVIGACSEVVTGALELLEQTDEDLLRAAYFDLEALEELAVDPRAYDFDHPVNKRPNYHFGQWDPHCIDNQGRFTRFVIQQVSLDALMARLESDEASAEELLVEAASVLAGIILMGSGISGSGPDTHDSRTTLTTLLPQIAGYRDAFYERLLGRVSQRHGERLLEEAAEKRQPFAAARQHLNAQLARRRASQLEHVQLARIYARIGYFDAASEEADVVPTPSARMLCQIDCRLTSARAAILDKDLQRSATLLNEIVETLHGGIACGAIVDPWNILGFDAQFSLFPSVENSVPDHRVEELVILMEEVFALFSQAWSDAAARDEQELCTQLSAEFRELAEWWRQFVAHEVSNIQAIDSLDAYQAAERVARALNLWHKGGAAAGDIGFWAPHAELFDSAQAYSLVIEALLDQSDHVAAMGLLVHWLSEGERIPLEQGEASFHRLAERWLCDLHCGSSDTENINQPAAATVRAEVWKLTCKFFDYVEANAEAYWDVPDFELASGGRNGPSRTVELADPFEADDADDLFGAAYEDVVFRDSADDGVEGQIFDFGDSTEDELIRETQRLSERLAFHCTLARVWRSSSLRHVEDSEDADTLSQRRSAIAHWIDKLQQSQSGLMTLIEQVRSYHIPRPQGEHDSMVEYDRRRMAKEGLLDRIIATAIETADAARLLQSVLAAESETECGDCTTAAFAAILQADHRAASQHVTALIEELADEPLLYVPLAKGGSPHDIVETRIRQRSLQDLLRCLPRLGLYVEAFRLIETARDMERNNPVGAGAVTEFDELFKMGYGALIESLVYSSEAWPEEELSEHRPPTRTDSPLVACIEQLTEACLHSWLAHSQTLRLSVLEKVSDKRSWTKLVEFVERYGDELFTQQFLNLGNVRAILHQGVDEWLAYVQEEQADCLECQFFEELDDQISTRDAVYHLTLVLEAVTENYGEYRDYNSTTTQSDRGELLYTFLDFLRLRTKYDRVCWNLKPVVLAHEILVRRGCKQAAQLWRRALRERIDTEADKFVERLKKLQKKYAMQMPSIADRIGERFMRPLIIDRLCALVQPARAEANRDGPRPTFRMLQYETEFLTREPSGVGFDLPPWLAALEEEVQKLMLPPYERDDYEELELVVPLRRLTYDEVTHRLDEWTAS